MTRSLKNQNIEKMKYWPDEILAEDILDDDKHLSEMPKKSA
jgi:hypothetical protein